MILNDVLDRKSDATNKQERPIPAGHISPAEALFYCLALLFLSVFLQPAHLGGLGHMPRGELFITLIVCIVSYNVLHKKFALAIIFMGLCRGIVYLYSFTQMVTRHRRSWLIHVESPEILWAAGMATLYIILLTFVARREDGKSPGVRAWLSVLMPVTIVAPMIVLMQDSTPTAWAMASLAIFTLWMARSCWFLLRKSPDIRGAVMGWLSGICLFDAALLALNGSNDLSFFAMGCFALTVLAHRFVPGT